MRSLYKTLLIPKPTPSQLAEAAEQNDGNFGEPGDFGTKPSDTFFSSSFCPGIRTQDEMISLR